MRRVRATRTAVTQHQMLRLLARLGHGPYALHYVLGQLPLRHYPGGALPAGRAAVLLVDGATGVNAANHKHVRAHWIGTAYRAVEHVVTEAGHAGPSFGGHHEVMDPDEMRWYSTLARYVADYGDEYRVYAVIAGPLL